MNFLPWFRFQASGKAILSYALALAGSCVLLCLIGHSTGWSEDEPGDPDPWTDSDGDGITDEDEWHLYHTDPYNADPMGMATVTTRKSLGTGAAAPPRFIGGDASHASTGTNEVIRNRADAGRLELKSASNVNQRARQY